MDGYMFTHLERVEEDYVWELGPEFLGKARQTLECQTRPAS